MDEDNRCNRQFDCTESFHSETHLDKFDLLLTNASGDCREDKEMQAARYGGEGLGHEPVAVKRALNGLTLGAV